MKKSKIGAPRLLCFSILSFLILCLAGTATDLAAQVNRGAAVPEHALPGELKGMEIKDHFVPSSLKRVGVIHGLNGTVVVIHRATKEAYFGRPGDVLFENDALSTLSDSRCRIRFFNEDVITIAQDSRFAVEEYVDQREEGKKKSLFSMVKGKAMFYAMRLFRYKDARFNLKTPTAVVGVRGTKFGAHVYYLEPEKRAEAGILVADSGNALGPYLAQLGPGSGAKSVTDCFSEDGYLDINGQIVSPGQFYQGLTGLIIPTPPEVIRTFNLETKVVPEGAKIEEEEAEPPADVLAVVVDREKRELDPAKKTSEEGQTPTEPLIPPAQEVPSAEKEFAPLAPPLKGYFSAFLKYQSSGWAREAFVSCCLQQTDPLDEAFAYGVYDHLNAVSADGYDNGAYTEDKGAVLLFGEGASAPRSIDGEAHAMDGLNYLQWGYHAAYLPPLTFPIGATTYELVNKFWFLEGHPTAASDIAALSGDYKYTGVVHGTVHPANVDVQGRYESYANFGTAVIHDFKFIDVQGGGHTVDFAQSGTADIDSGGQFMIEAPDGSFKIDGSAVAYWNVNGAHFGPGAAEQGGAWAAICPTTNKGAWGIFAGQKAP